MKNPICSCFTADKLKSQSLNNIKIQIFLACLDSMPINQKVNMQIPQC